MIVTGKVVGKMITPNGVFTRIKIDANGFPKSTMRFFDVPDQQDGNDFTLEEKVDIYINRKLQITNETLQELTTALSCAVKLSDVPGCMYHSAPEPADIVGATGTILHPLVKSNAIFGEGAPYEIQNGSLGQSGCESPASEISIDEQGHQQV